VNERILIAEDEEIVRTNIQEYLGSEGYDVDTAPDGRAALDRVLGEDYGLVITDIQMPGMDGIELLGHIVAERPDTSVLIITAYASVETALAALRQGAYDYLLKPVAFEDLIKRIQNLFAYRELRHEVTRLRRTISDRLGFEGIVGESPAIRAVFDLIDRVAPSDATVLITGESGTGKELAARAIHTRSNRASKEFLSVNMAALPHETTEAQLFGHEKGAFTGADRHRDGVLRSVGGGTIFLDEVGELPLHAQSKLLRAVEMKEILPLGAERPTRAEFRLLTATNRNLETAVEEKSFREDLYFRINVFQIVMPPLRERRDDIPALVEHFLSLHGRAQGSGQVSISNDAMRALLSYAWPGNVRELSNVIERACILTSSGRIEERDLPSELVATSGLPTGLKDAVEEFERRHIAWILRVSDGNRERAAEMLGVDPATLYRRLAKYKLQDA